MIILLTTLAMATHEHLLDDSIRSKKDPSIFIIVKEKNFFHALRQCEIIIFKKRAMNSMAVTQIYKRERKSK
jgi:hypothetical protein